MADSAKTRVKRELGALLKKINALDDFLQRTDLNQMNISEEQLHLMGEQRRLMVGYKVILEKRLVIWE